MSSVSNLQLPPRAYLRRPELTATPPRPWSSNYMLTRDILDDDCTHAAPCSATEEHQRWRELLFALRKNRDNSLFTLYRRAASTRHPQALADKNILSIACELPCITLRQPNVICINVACLRNGKKRETRNLPR